MELRNLGRSGLRVLAIGLGCNFGGRTGLEASRAVVHAALDKATVAAGSWPLPPEDLAEVDRITAKA